MRGFFLGGINRHAIYNCHAGPHRLQKYYFRYYLGTYFGIE